MFTNYVIIVSLVITMAIGIWQRDWSTVFLSFTAIMGWAQVIAHEYALKRLLEEQSKDRFQHREF